MRRFQDLSPRKLTERAGAETDRPRWKRMGTLILPDLV